MLENKITGYLWQNPPSACTEGDKDSRIRLLQVWKPPTITVFGQRRCFGGHGTRGAGAPAPPAISDSRVSWCRVWCQCGKNLPDKYVSKGGSTAEGLFSRARERKRQSLESSQRSNPQCDSCRKKK